MVLRSGRAFERNRPFPALPYFVRFEMPALFPLPSAILADEKIYALSHFEVPVNTSKCPLPPAAAMDGRMEAWVPVELWAPADSPEELLPLKLAPGSTTGFVGVHKAGASALRLASGSRARAPGSLSRAATRGSVRGCWRGWSSTPCRCRARGRVVRSQARARCAPARMASPLPVH